MRGPAVLQPLQQPQEAAHLPPVRGRSAGGRGVPAARPGRPRPTPWLELEAWRAGGGTREGPRPAVAEAGGRRHGPRNPRRLGRPGSRGSRSERKLPAGAQPPATGRGRPRAGPGAGSGLRSQSHRSTCHATPAVIRGDAPSASQGLYLVPGCSPERSRCPQVRALLSPRRGPGVRSAGRSGGRGAPVSGGRARAPTWREPGEGRGRPGVRPAGPGQAGPGQAGPCPRGRVRRCRPNARAFQIQAAGHFPVPFRARFQRPLFSLSALPLFLFSFSFSK